MSRSRQLPAVIHAFPPYPGLGRMTDITARAGRIMIKRGLTSGKTPEQTAARIMQDYCSDTPKTYRGGPDLFRKIDGEGWGLRDTYEKTYAKAGVTPYVDSGNANPVGNGDTEALDNKLSGTTSQNSLDFGNLQEVLSAIREIERSTPYRLTKLKGTGDWAFAAPTIR
jgi:hypothetical protein